MDPMPRSGLRLEPTGAAGFSRSPYVDDRDRVLTTPARPEPICPGREPGLPLGFQRIPAARLVRAISYRGDECFILRSFPGVGRLGI